MATPRRRRFVAGGWAACYSPLLGLGIEMEDLVGGRPDASFEPVVYGLGFSVSSQIFFLFFLVRLLSIVSFFCARARVNIFFCLVL